MTGLPSNIKVFPSFPDTAFFSGEDFTCTLTFKNVAEPSPASSETSLSPIRGVKNVRRGTSNKFAGGEWMVEAGRSASEGGTGAPGARILSPHGRSFSTVGQPGVERSRGGNNVKTHLRSQSMAIGPVSSEPNKLRESPSTKERIANETSNGVPKLSIDTRNTESKAPVSAPSVTDTMSPSPLAQISKLDLHSTIEDDASSETSSIGPSNTLKQSHTSHFNSFSPRPSLDIREPDPDLAPQRLVNRRLPRSPLGRTSHEMGPQAETLMMGYAQLTGGFMIDEALVHASEFEEIKSKGIVGGKSGGGVVGVDSRRGASWTGLGSLGTFGLGAFFGGAQPSSLAEMRDRAGSKTIPILSTPPSILFVDIRVSPGESRSFSYTFRLPKNLPPSHRGRALRISYSLVITTQRPGQSQQLSTAEIPFRVFSNLDGSLPFLSDLIIEYCQQPTYDLKSPIILLRDQAKTRSLKEGEDPSPPTKAPSGLPTGRRLSTYSDKPIESSREEFMDFVDNLLGSLGKVPLSATDPYAKLSVPRSPSPTPTRERMRRLSSREAVDYAVQRGMGPGAGTKAHVGVFEIGKNGVAVAKLTLPRTTYKLGEVIEGIIDLGNGPIKCYQIRSALESAEEIDDAISVRSRSSVYRATRRVHGSKSEFTAFARRVSFSFEIPTGAAPSFQTSSIRHNWALRLEFMTSLTPHQPPQDTDDQAPSEPVPVPEAPKLLELSEHHDRGDVFVATDTLYCESFDCHVPIMVLATNQEIPEDRVGLAGFVV